MEYKIYTITNKINGKIYIGCTQVELQRRFRQHCNEKRKNTILKSAIKKYGVDNFTIALIETVSDREIMFTREIYWIAHYNTTKLGYNMMVGGNSGPIMIGINNPNYGKPIHPNALIGARRKKGPMSQEIKDKISDTNKNKPKSNSFKKILSEKMKARWDNGEMVESSKKMALTKTGRPSGKRQPIICLNNGIIYSHYQEAAQALGVSAGNIPQVINGIYSHTKGFRFQRIT